MNKSLHIYPTNKIAKVEVAASSDLQWYDSYFKIMHHFRGSRVHISTDYRIKDYDKKSVLAVHCPHCGSALNLQVKGLMDKHGKAQCEKCVSKFLANKGSRDDSKFVGVFVVTPRGYIVYPQTFNTKVASVISDKNKILNVLHEYGKHVKVNVSQSLAGITVICDSKKFKDLEDEIYSHRFNYEVGRENKR